MIKVSPSGISSLLECPRCLWLQVNEEKKRPRGIYPSLPDGMDNVFKNYFDEYRARGEMPPEIEGKVAGRLFDDLRQLKTLEPQGVGGVIIGKALYEGTIDLREAIGLLGC